MYHNSIIPFYVAYPNYQMYSDEYRRNQDLEYLQAMYPTTVKAYQRTINEVLDRIDYEGSMIYDEFPDRISLYKLASDITQIIVSENQRSSMQDNGEENMQNGQMRENTMDVEHIGIIVQILLYHEIHKRRHRRNDSFLNF